MQTDLSQKGENFVQYFIRSWAVNKQQLLELPSAVFPFCRKILMLGILKTCISTFLKAFMMNSLSQE